MVGRTDYYTQIQCQSDTSALWLVWAGYLHFGVPATVARAGRLPRLWKKRTTSMKRRRPPGQMRPTLESQWPRATTPFTTKHSHDFIIKVPTGISSIACLNVQILSFPTYSSLLLNPIVINITRITLNSSSERILWYSKAFRSTNSAEIQLK